MAINIPQLTALAQKGVTAFHKKVLPLAAFSVDFSEEVKNFNESVIVPVIGKPSPAKEFAHATGYEGGQNSTLTSEAIQLTTRLYTDDVLPDTQFTSLSPDTFERLSAAQNVNVLDQAAQKVAAAVLAAAGATHVCKAANFDYAAALKLKTAATTAGLPSTGRVLILDSAAHDTLTGDSKIASSFVAAIATKAIEEGETSRVAGMTIFEQSGFETGVNGFLALPYALAIASRATPISGREIFATQVKDEATGFTLTKKLIADDQHAQMRMITECFFGCKVVVPAAIMKIAEQAG